jgi:hypothetical protein
LEGLVSEPANNPDLEEPTDLPDKPPIDDMPPEEGIEPPTEEEEAQDTESPDFLDHTRAEADDTIDNAESEDYTE